MKGSETSLLTQSNEIILCQTADAVGCSWCTCCYSERLFSRRINTTNISASVTIVSSLQSKTGNLANNFVHNDSICLMTTPSTHRYNFIDRWQRSVLGVEDFGAPHESLYQLVNTTNIYNLHHTRVSVSSLLVR